MDGYLPSSVMIESDTHINIYIYNDWYPHHVKISIGILISDLSILFPYFSLLYLQFILFLFLSFFPIKLNPSLLFVIFPHTSPLERDLSPPFSYFSLFFLFFSFSFSSTCLSVDLDCRDLNYNNAVMIMRKKKKRKKALSRPATNWILKLTLSVKIW